MANYATLKAAVQAVVKTNGNKEITGANLQTVLLSVINSLGAGYQFMGVATPSTDAGTPDNNVAYIGAAGTYANFGSSITIPVGSIGVFKYNGSWINEVLDIYAGIGNYLADDKTIDASPSYENGAMRTDGTVASSSQYGYFAPIELPAGSTIYLNMGNPLYHGYLVSCLYKTDSSGNFIENLISGSGTVAESYTNISENTIYVGVSGYYNQLGYIVASPTKASSLSSVIKGWILSESFLIVSATYTDGIINSPISVEWADKITGTISFVRNSDGDITSLTATHGNDSYTLSITRDGDGNVTKTELT